MDNSKNGYYSIILRKDYFEKYLNEDIFLNKHLIDKNVLLKITIENQMGNYNGEIHLGPLLNKIDKYSLYFAKYYTENIYSIDPENKLLVDLKKSLNENHILFKKQHLIYYYIENVGDIELFDIMNTMRTLNVNVFSQNKNVLLFSYQMLNAIKYLHDNLISHFDIKPENIIYKNDITIPIERRFKIIDFGFAEKYPFRNYLNCGKICGTSYYLPLPSRFKTDTDDISDMLMRDCNDWIYYKENNNLKPIHYCSYYNKNENLLFKSDVYSLGIIFFQILYLKIHNSYFPLDKKEVKNFKKNYQDLINKMTDNNILYRYTIYQCFNHRLIKKFNDSFYDSNENDDDDDSNFRQKKKKMKFCC